ncbi:MAG: TIGR03808 family TAT-translocated repetitive protein [Rhizobiales bacterium]|nr:TIGR03808 family TAT-translocated repetitive protein [Hyphomicrobiales bacterium]
MRTDRRHFLALSAAATVAAAATPARAAVQLSALGVDATQLGVNPASSEDQSLALQRAIDRAAAARVPLVLPPGVYRAANLKLPKGAALAGMHGASRLMLSDAASLLAAEGADDVVLSGLTLDGGGKRHESRGLVRITGGRSVRVVDCTFDSVTNQALLLEGIAGEVRSNVFNAPGDGAIRSLDARDLVINGNTIRDAGNAGIQVWRSAIGYDGTIVTENRIEDTRARDGGSGQYGNAINVFRAGNVIVANNRIAGAAFSAVRGNAASNIQILGNNCTRCAEVAIYSEFEYQGAVIANNVVDGAAFGVALANFQQGGRLAVVQGNLIRNLTPKRPPGTDPGDAAGIGIGVEADVAVTGNVIENVPNAGISVGWGPYQRDVTVSGNTVRGAAYGITVSVSKDAGSAVVTGNLIAEVRKGAIVGMNYRNVATGDLAKDGVGRFTQLTVSGNHVR